MFKKIFFICICNGCTEVNDVHMPDTDGNVTGVIGQYFLCFFLIYVAYVGSGHALVIYPQTVRLGFHFAI